jgi:membrane-associated phospholipid phosphatase
VANIRIKYLKNLQNFSFVSSPVKKCTFRTPNGEKLQSRAKTNGVLQAAHLFLLLFFITLNLYGIDNDNPQAELPAPYTRQRVTLAFHDIGRNVLHSVSYNYGLNLVGAGLGTWAFIETGLDWKWRNIAYNRTWLLNCGRPGLYMGYILPPAAPIITYTVGALIENEKLQVTALALAQSLMLTLAIQTPLKMITGRALPGIVTELDHTRSSRQDDFSGEFDWFNKNFVGGWPSAHTANAFAAAATISEIYKSNKWLNIGMYSYAALIGIGVTLDVHWASEAFAGALIGYAIGKTVGKSFNKMLKKNEMQNNISFYFTTNTIGINIAL